MLRSVCAISTWIRDYSNQVSAQQSILMDSPKGIKGLPRPPGISRPPTSHYHELQQQPQTFSLGTEISMKNGLVCDIWTAWKNNIPIHQESRQQKFFLPDQKKVLMLNVFVEWKNLKVIISLFLFFYCAPCVWKPTLESNQHNDITW